MPSPPPTPKHKLNNCSLSNSFILKWQHLHSLQNVFQYFASCYLIGILSMLLNSHDLFLYPILPSVTTSWCNAPMNSCTLTICLCSCNNSALHTAWMPIITECWICSAISLCPDSSSAKWCINWLALLLFSLFQIYHQNVLWYCVNIHYTVMVTIIRLNAFNELIT